MSGPLLQQPGLAVRPDNREMITLLRSKVAGDESFGACSFIHDADAYSAAPEDLVHGHEHSPGTDKGDGKGMTWYFWSPANCHESAQGGSTRRRQRAVRGAAEGACWHSEKGKRAVVGADGRTTVGYIRKLSYGIKIKKSPDTMARSFTRLGWCMDEFGLEQQDGADQIVLCKLYRSPRADQATATAGSSRSQEAPPPIEREPSSDHDPLPLYAKPVNDPTYESEAIVKNDGGGEARDGEMAATGFTVVMKFGRSSVASAERMREVADLIPSFPEEKPVVVLSAMGKTTNNLLLAGEKAVNCGAAKASEIRELAVIRELHLRTIDELGLDKSIVSGFLDELERFLKDIAMRKEFTLRTRHYLVSFGERMSTRIFAAYLNKLGKKARQYDAVNLGFITTKDFTNADILEATYPGVAKRLQGDWNDDPAIPIVTGFLGNRGGSDLTAMTIGKALGLREIQVWKDVDGVMTCDPKIFVNAILVPYLTFDEATELPCFGAQAMQLAKESGITITVKNSCDPQAPGTVITKTRDMSKSELTSIALKSNITMLDIVSTRMLRQYDFLAKVFSILKDSGTSVDCVATSEGKISFTQAPSKLSSPELIHQELSNIVKELEKIADVHILQQRSIISLIGNGEMSSIILEKAFNVLRRIEVNVQLMISPGASKVMNVSLVVHDSEAKQCVQALHLAFLENGFSQVEGTDLGKNGSPTPVKSSAAASSSSKRKVAEDHPEARSAVRRQTDEEDNILPQRDDPTPMPDDLDVLASSKEGGEPAMPRSAPSAVTEEDAGTGSWTDHESMALLDSNPVLAECSTDMPCPASAEPYVDHPEAPPSVRQERTDTDGGPLEEIKGLLFSDDYPMLDGLDDGRVLEIEGSLLSDDVPVGVDDGGAQADFYFSPGILEVQAEQQGLTEAAEEGSGLRTEEEALPSELNPEELLGVSSSEMPWLAPALASASCDSELHVAEECQTSGCGRCVAEAAGL